MWLFSVGFVEGVYRFPHSDSGIVRVEDNQESLDEGMTENEVDSRFTWGPKVANNQIKAISSTTNNTVVATRPELSVRR